MSEFTFNEETFASRIKKGASCLIEGCEGVIYELKPIGSLQEAEGVKEEWLVKCTRGHEYKVYRVLSKKQPFNYAFQHYDPHVATEVMSQNYVIKSQDIITSLFSIIVVLIVLLILKYSTSLISFSSSLMFLTLFAYIASIVGYYGYDMLKR